jgi:hypothetical protein
VPPDAPCPPALVTQLLTHPGRVQGAQGAGTEIASLTEIAANAQAHLARLDRELAAINVAWRTVKSQIRKAKKQRRNLSGRRGGRWWPRNGRSDVRVGRLSANY